MEGGSISFNNVGGELQPRPLREISRSTKRKSLQSHVTVIAAHLKAPVTRQGEENKNRNRIREQTQEQRSLNITCCLNDALWW